MKNPGKLFHATPTGFLKSIFERGLDPDEYISELRPCVNLSTKDETDLVAFFGYMNGVLDDDGEAVGTITLLEVDTRGLTLEWPGQDGDHHFVCHEVIPPERLRVVSECTLDEVKELSKGD